MRSLGVPIARLLPLGRDAVPVPPERRCRDNPRPTEEGGSIVFVQASGRTPVARFLHFSIENAKKVGGFSAPRRERRDVLPSARSGKRFQFFGLERSLAGGIHRAPECAAREFIRLLEK